jgi:hypothetical protein
MAHMALTKLALLLLVVCREQVFGEERQPPGWTFIQREQILPTRWALGVPLKLVLLFLAVMAHVLVFGLDHPPHGWISIQLVPLGPTRGPRLDQPKLERRLSVALNMRVSGPAPLVRG